MNHRWPSIDRPSSIHQFQNEINLKTLAIPPPARQLRQCASAWTEPRIFALTTWHHMTTFCSARMDMMDVLWRASCLSKDLSTAAVANSKVLSLNLSKAQQSIEATRSPVWTCRQLRTLLFFPPSANMLDTHLLKYSQVSKCNMEMVICPDMPSFHLFLHLMYLMFTLCLYTDSALIHSVSFQQQTFPSSPNGFHRISRYFQPPKSVQEQIGFEHLSRSSVMTVQNFLLIFFTNSLIILILFDFHCIIFYHLVKFPNFHIFDLDVFGLRRWCQRKDAPHETIQNLACKSIGDIPRTSTLKWTIRHTALCILGCFEMFGRAEILWLVIDWSIDPNIILQFMKITSTQSLAGILILAIFCCHGSGLQHRKLS